MRSLLLISLLVTVVASCKDSGTKFTFDSGPVIDGGSPDVPKVDAGGDTLAAVDGNSANDVGVDQVALDSGADLPSGDVPADLAINSDGADDGAPTGDAE